MIAEPNIHPSPVLHDREFEKISRLAYEQFGVDLRQGKQALVEARLGRKLRELGLDSFERYYDYVTGDRTGDALAAMADVLTTNHTSFFREPRHFELLRDIIFPALRNRPQIHIWSAACSTGEEPYSIAMTSLVDPRTEAPARLTITASDISTRVLEIARRGIFTSERLKDVPVPFVHRFMLKGHNASADSFRFKPEVRSLIRFERRNLMHPIDQDYRCSVIFCCNLMIYFDAFTRQNLVKRLSSHLEDGGYLFIGHSESLNSIAHELEYISPATYRKRGGPRHLSGSRSSKTGQS